MDYSGRLSRADWTVRPVSIEIASRLVRDHHYAHGAANTATYLHGLFPASSFWQDDCAGVAWWIPPTRSAAEATHPANWRGVLFLSRLVIVPGVPKNACTFLLARSMRLIDRDRWPMFVTYADEGQGHTGTIYRAANWREAGRTAPEATFFIGDRMVARKAGPKTRTRGEMEALGARLVGRHSKRKFTHFAGRVA